MLGDDLDSLVMTAQVGFGGVSDMRVGSAGWQERLGGHGQEGSKNPIGLGTVNEGNGEKLGTQLRTVTSFVKTCGCKLKKTMMATSADAMQMMR